MWKLEKRGFKEHQKGKIQWPMTSSNNSSNPWLYSTPTVWGPFGKNLSFGNLWTSHIPMTCFVHQTGVAWVKVVELWPNFCQKTRELWHWRWAIDTPCMADKKDVHISLACPPCLALRFNPPHVWINQKHWLCQVDRVCKWHWGVLRSKVWLMGEKQCHGCTVILCYAVFSLFNP